jgi:hypothetical protein
MGLKALTNISHSDKDGKPVWFNAGDDVKESDFSKEQWEQLKEDGAVGVPAANAAEVADENEVLRKQVEDLQRQLAAAKKPAEVPPK